MEISRNTKKTPSSYSMKSNIINAQEYFVHLPGLCHYALDMFALLFGCDGNGHWMGV